MFNQKKGETIMRRISMVLLACLMLLSGNLSVKSQGTTLKTIRVGVSWNEKMQSLVQAWQDYMQQYGEAFGKKWNVKFEWVINVADGDPARQGANIEDLISKKVDVIVARPQDAAAISSSIKAAQTAGIPFITFDRQAVGAVPTAHVGADSLNQSITTGEAFAALLKQNNVQGQCIELM